MNKKIFNQLNQLGLTIAFAESMTGGFSAFQLIKHQGASSVIKGSIIAYSDHAKIHLLGIDPLLIASLSSISKEVSIEMAKSIKDIMNADIGVGITGNAGPSLQMGSTEYEAHIAIVFQDQIIYEHLSLDGLSRIKSIRQTTAHTYTKIDELISTISR